MNWQNLSVSIEKYVRFSPSCNFSGYLGGEGIGRRVILGDARQNDLTENLGGNAEEEEVEETAGGREGNMRYDSSDRLNCLRADDCNTARKMVATNHQPPGAQEPTLMFTFTSRLPRSTYPRIQRRFGSSSDRN